MSVRIWIDSNTHRLVHITEDYNKFGTPTIYSDTKAFWKSSGKLMLVS